MRGRIKIGSRIGHDHAYMRWPLCKAPAGSLHPYVADDPNMVFEMEPFLHGVLCTAPGFGEVGGHYGNGSIFVWGKP